MKPFLLAAAILVSPLSVVPGGIAFHRSLPPDDAGSRAAPGSLAVPVRADVEGDIAALPYRIGDRAGFRPVRVQNDSAVFTDGPADPADPGAQATVTVSPSPELRNLPEIPNAQRDRILRELAGSDPALADPVVEVLGAVQAGDTLRYEVVAKARLAGSGREVVRAVAVVFPGGTPLRVVATAPESERGEILPRLRSFVKGISGRR